MKSGRSFVLLLFFIFLLFAGTGCKVKKHHRRFTGVIISTEPHGRLAPGEVDNMSGKVNEMPPKKEKDTERKKETDEKHKKPEEKNAFPFAPQPKKKFNRR
jgi:hypothetical protein